MIYYFDTSTAFFDDLASSPIKANSDHTQPFLKVFIESGTFASSDEPSSRRQEKSIVVSPT
jgi:hypothetical protein